MSGDTFTVVVTLESSDAPDGVEMKWYSGHDPLKALLAVGQCIEHHENPTHPHPVRMLSVRVDTTPISETSDTSTESETL
jgi:hypothetical protein